MAVHTDGQYRAVRDLARARSLINTLDEKHPIIRLELAQVFVCYLSCPMGPDVIVIAVVE